MARKLQIDVTVDDKGAVRTLGKVEKGIKGVSTAAPKMGSATRTALAAFAGFGAAGLALGALSRAMRFAGGAAIGMNAKLETTTLQFKTLMGDAGAAEAHVKSLFEFAKRTPFETGPIIEASRLMRTFGGSALDSAANLQLIGDAAAATGAPINELGMWTGRLFAQLQAGKPFGEAAQRLSELAVLTPQARMKMEDLQKTGASADEVFRAFRDELGKFGGALEEQAETFSGLTSTMWENVSLFIAEKSTPAFDALKFAIKGVNSAFESMNAGPVGRAASQLDDLMQRQLIASEIATRQFEQMGKVTHQLQFQIETRGKLIAEIKAMNAEAEAAATAAEEEAAAAVVLTTSVAAAKEEHSRAEQAIHKTRMEMERLHVQMMFMRTEWETVTFDILPAFRVGLDEIGVRVKAVGKNFDDVRARMASPTGFFATIKRGFGDIFSGITGGSGVSGFLSNLGSGITEGLGAILSGGVSTLINKGFDLAWKGAQKLWGGLKRLFGGPSAAEIGGRDVANEWRRSTAAMMTDEQRLRANQLEGGKEWRESIIPIMDAYLGVGRTSEEALDVSRRLWEAEKEGPEAAKAVIEEINAVMKEFNETQKEGLATIEAEKEAVLELTGAYYQLSVAKGASQQHNEDFSGDKVRQNEDGSVTIGVGRGQGKASGGLIEPEYFARGGFSRGTDTVPAMLTPGEFVMSRPAVQAIGACLLAAMNSGRSMGSSVQVNINGMMFLDNPRDQKRIAKMVEAQVLRELGQRRVVSGRV